MSAIAWEGLGVEQVTLLRAGQLSHGVVRTRAVWKGCNAARGARVWMGLRTT